MNNPVSKRLLFHRVTEADHAVLHALMTDAHVKEFLFDGVTMTEEQTRAVITDSHALFKSDGVGIWLLSTTTEPEKIGFCGFRHFPRYGSDPELLYAFLKTAAGKGYATECATAMIEFVKTNKLKKRIESAVDSPNLASKKVLEKVGFQKTGEIPGAFDPIITYELFV